MSYDSGIELVARGCRPQSTVDGDATGFRFIAKGLGWYDIKVHQVKINPQKGSVMVELSYPEIRVAVTKKMEPDEGNTYAMNFAGLSVDAVRVFSISAVLHAALETMLEEFAKNDKGEIQDNIEAQQMSQSDLTKIVTGTDVKGNVVKTIKGRVIKSGTYSR